MGRGTGRSAVDRPKALGQNVFGEDCRDLSCSVIGTHRFGVSVQLWYNLEEGITEVVRPDWSGLSSESGEETRNNATNRIKCVNLLSQEKRGGLAIAGPAESRFQRLDSHL